MKKLFSIFVVLSLIFVAVPTVILGQDEAPEPETTTEQTDTTGTTVASEEAAPDTAAANDEPEDLKFQQSIKKIFIDGGYVFMSLVLITLILGLALSIERIIYLNMAQTNTKKLLESVEDKLNNGGVSEAKEMLRNTKGPVASIFFQGLERSGEGLDMVEKSVINYGSVQVGQMEKGLSWISLFISLAPMLGFMGTVLGMIEAFNSIEASNNISPAQVAGGIKIALITTVSGLVVAIILQIFYNYILSKIDSITNDMDDASISLVDILAKHKLS